MDGIDIIIGGTQFAELWKIRPLYPEKVIRAVNFKMAQNGKNGLYE